ncbi:uncharacterized protein LOC118349401 [Juglans regia]|uniref:Uncharacterized protein LOC118349401 n=1 Tax=Juglans regia TaxID=51240 RepID=A0A6P9F4U9_JUGRE|nr:uncharacterized protein LOC118349401 [Juglans regia]
MAAGEGGTGRPSFADLVSAVPQPIPEMVLAPRIPKVLDGEVYFQFTKEEIARSAEPFRYSVVLKFLKNRPSLDTVRAFIHNRWGLTATPVVSAMRRPRNVFVRMSNDVDFTKALSREVCEINGIFYRVFRWSPEFNEDAEPSRVPVWISLPGLPPNFYQESFLKMLMAPIGTFIRRDNPTRCATRTDGARLCVEVDAAKPPLSHFWIGVPGVSSSRKQEIVYETLPAFCSSCKMQGHDVRTCNPGKAGKKGGRKESTKGLLDDQEVAPNEDKVETPLLVLEDKETEDVVVEKETEAVGIGQVQLDAEKEVLPMQVADQLVQVDSEDKEKLEQIGEENHTVITNGVQLKSYVGTEDATDLMLHVGVADGAGMVTDADYVMSNMDANQSFRADNNGMTMEQMQPVGEADSAEDVNEEVDEETMLEENCSSEPEPEQHPERGGNI